MMIKRICSVILTVCLSLGAVSALAYRMEFLRSEYYILYITVILQQPFCSISIP